MRSHSGNLIFCQVHTEYGNLGDVVVTAPLVRLLRRYGHVVVNGVRLLRGTGRGWNRSGMHHAAVHEVHGGWWLAAVDGFARHLTVPVQF